jgi:retron-type reverse transcriptase
VLTACGYEVVGRPSADTAGVDGKTRRGLGDYGLDRTVRGLHQELQDGRYLPQPLKHRLIPKANGASRQIVIPTLRDRIVSLVLAKVVGAVFTPRLHPASSAFVPERGPHYGLRLARQQLLNPEVRAVATFDIRAFFDSIDRTLLLEQFVGDVDDRFATMLVNLVVHAPVVGRGRPQHGLHQGLGLSPILANIYRHPLDMYLDDHVRCLGFSEFAASLFETKAKNGDIKSAAGRRRWADVLVHLIKGTTGHRSKRYVEGFGDYFIDKITFAHVERWKNQMADLVQAGDYSPTTINGWLAIFKVIMKAAKRSFQLPTLATEGVEPFDTSDRVVYSEESPNALQPEEVGPFLAYFREHYPTHFAMAYLGFATGLRPSSLRPLRRSGAQADVKWDEGRLLIRRSQTLGDEVMDTTKNKRRYSIDLPADVMRVLRWHVETQLRTPEQQDSELLFPSTTGGFRSAQVLGKPFARTAKALGLEKKISQRAMRRTFNDLRRAAQIEDIVARSISGHLTQEMGEHYSTVNATEQRAALAKVIQLFTPALRAGGEDGGEGALPSGEETKKAGQA